MLASFTWRWIREDLYSLRYLQATQHHRKAYLPLHPYHMRRWMKVDRTTMSYHRARSYRYGPLS
jgi:hypothetical protein